MTFEILLPVTHHALQVTSVPAGTETRLETLILRYVHHVGTTDIAHVARTFGLRHRMALGVALSLWREGSLVVDLHRGDIRVTPAVADLCERNELETLSERRRKTGQQDVVLEPISGFVGLFKDTRRPGTGEGSLIAPAPADPIEITDVLTRDLLAVVLRAQRSTDTFDPSIRRIVEVGLSSPLSTPISPVNARFLPLEVSATRHDDDIQIRVVPEGSRMTAAQRRRIETYLLDLVADRQDERLVTTIRNQAQGPLLDPPTIAERIGAMRRMAARAGEAQPPERLQSAHDGLVDQAVAVNRELADLERSAACTLDLVTSARLLRAAAIDLIRDAREQVVISSPWVRESAVNTLVPALREALDRNVDVVILWGIKDGEQLHPDVLNQFATLSGQSGPGRLLVARRSAQTHAKLVVQDDRAFLLSSHNLLSSDDGKTEIGLLVTDTEEGLPQVIGDALRWVQTAFPSYRQARTLLLQRDRPAISTRTELPTPPPVDGDALKIDAWQRAWQGYVDETERRDRDVGACVQGLVENQRHRLLLTEALRHASRRVLATGQRLTAQSVNAAMLGEFRRYLERSGEGILVLVYEASDEADGSVLAAFADLAEKFPGRFVARGADAWHAKVLVWDDQFVVSSFNFLSFEGAYQDRPGRTRSELGLHVRGGEVADQLFEAVIDAAGVRSLAPPVAGSDRSEPSRSFANGGPLVWERIRGLLDLDPEVVAQSFLARVPAQDRQDVVRALQTTDGYADLAEQLAAAVLGTGVDERSWSLRLGMEAWARSDFLLAHSILPTDLAEPSMALRVTAAALDSASIGPVLAALGPAEFRAEERPALLLASIWALLNGHTEALPVVMQEDEALPAFRRAAVEYYERSLGRAAPWDDLHAHDREAKRAERLAEKRAAIREALAQLERSNSLNYREGRALQRYWRSSASSFSELRQILDDGNPASPWLDRWGADAVSFVAANCDAGEAGEIELGRQPGLRQRIDRVLAQVDDYARTQALGGDLDGLNAVVEDLRAALREAGPLTLPPPDQPPGPVDPVVARCRELLFGGSA